MQHFTRLGGKVLPDSIQVPAAIERIAQPSSWSVSFEEGDGQSTPQRYCWSWWKEAQLADRLRVLWQVFLNIQFHHLTPYCQTSLPWRFGFRLNDGDNESTTSLEEKADKLWRQAQDQLQKATEVVVYFCLLLFCQKKCLISKSYIIFILRKPVSHCGRQQFMLLIQGNSPNDFF